MSIVVVAWAEVTSLTTSALALLDRVAAMRPDVIIIDKPAPVDSSKKPSSAMRAATSPYPRPWMESRAAMSSLIVIISVILVRYVGSNPTPRGNPVEALTSGLRTVSYDGRMCTLVTFGAVLIRWGVACLMTSSKSECRKAKNSSAEWGRRSTINCFAAASRSNAVYIAATFSRLAE